jgi:hypothetical protein
MHPRIERIERIGSTELRDRARVFAVQATRHGHGHGHCIFMLATHPEGT